MKPGFVLPGSVVAMILSLGVAGAWAGPIGPGGFDLFATSPGTSLTFDPDGPAGPLTPVTVALAGVPIGLGNTDTIVQRKNPVAIPPGGAIPPNPQIPIEMVALSLQSLHPVNIGGTNFNLRVLGGDFLIPRSSPDGSITNLTHVDPVGGTFDSILPIDVDLIFTEVNNSANTMTVRFTDTLLGVAIPWSHSAPPNDPHNATFPAGNFFPCVTALTRLICVESGLSGNEVHTFTPASIPAPSVLVLLGVGLAGLSVMACWRRHL